MDQHKQKASPEYVSSAQGLQISSDHTDSSSDDENQTFGTVKADYDGGALESDSFVHRPAAHAILMCSTLEVPVPTSHIDNPLKQNEQDKSLEGGKKSYSSHSNSY